ncbi:hypothetical protein CYMTET_35453 [Cymbomonas tetramitiformis]|uniref:Polycystin domain-containing protein n=1 Tax=Cymbomonas tetramitiformis TaxID=36881 RepID=A0AAE0F955_9CHLO|nr:hypothetical protein CYMTET_35453 [Cymbomonas tetramitiformis]
MIARSKNFAACVSQVIASQQYKYYPNSEDLNEYGIPYGFHSFDMKGIFKGYPFVLDVNLNSERAIEMINYLEESNYIDNENSQVRVQILTYNGNMDFFVNSVVMFTSQPGGTIHIVHDIDVRAPFSLPSLRGVPQERPLHIPPSPPFRLLLGQFRRPHGRRVALGAVKVESTIGTMSWVRIFFEVALAICFVMNLYSETSEMVDTYRETESVMPYFKDFFNVIDCMSLAALGGIIMLYVYIRVLGGEFDIERRYRIYESLTGYDEYGQHVNWLELYNGRPTHPLTWSTQKASPPIGC